MSKQTIPNKGKTPFPEKGLDVLYEIIALGKVNMFYNQWDLKKLPVVRGEKKEDWLNILNEMVRKFSFHSGSDSEKVQWIPCIVEREDCECV